MLCVREQYTRFGSQGRWFQGIRLSLICAVSWLLSGGGPFRELVWGQTPEVRKPGTQWVVRVAESRVAIPIPRVQRTFGVGEKAFFLQENDACIVLAVQDVQGESSLVAVPRRKAGQKTGWVSPEGVFFFAYAVPAIDGVYYLKGPLELPFIGSSTQGYVVNMMYRSQSIPLIVPTNVAALVAVQERSEPSSMGVRASAGRLGLPSTDVVQRAVRIETPERARPPPLSHARPKAPVPVTTEDLLAALDTNWDVSVLSYLAPDDWATPSQPELRATSPADRFGPSALSKRLAKWLGLISRVWQSVVGVLIVILLGVAYFVRKRQTTAPARPKPPSVLPKVSEAKPGTELAEVPGKVGVHTAPVPDFSGTLSSMSLGSVLQFLNADKETGELTVYDEAHGVQGKVILVDGEIYDAETDSEKGVPALASLHRVTKGSFAFVRSTRRDIPRAIQEPTLGLLLEIHRVLDEQKEQPTEAVKPSPPPKKKPLKLQRRAGH